MLPKEIDLNEGLDLMNLVKLMMSFLIKFCVNYCNLPENNDP